MTPEGRVKQAITRVLKSHPSVYSLMPVQHGLGAAGVDYHCVVGVMMNVNDTTTIVPIAFFIEAKKPGDGPTPRQENFIKERQQHQGARTFVIDEDPTINKGNGLQALAYWLEEIERNNERLRNANTSNP